MSNNILVNEINKVFSEIKFEEFVEDGKIDIYFDSNELELKYIDRFPTTMDFRGIHSIYQTFYGIECKNEKEQEFKDTIFKVASYKLTRVILFILNYSKNIIMSNNYYDLLKKKNENANISFYSNISDYLLRVDDFTEMDKLILLALKDIIKIDFYLLDLGIILRLTSDLACAIYSKYNKMDSVIEKICNVEGFYLY